MGGTDYDYAYSVTQTPDGGLAVAGYTTSFGAGGEDFLALKLGPDGNYPECVRDCSPTVMNPSPSTSSPTPSSSSPSVGANCAPTVTTPSLTITDACTPLDLEERNILPRPGITCSPLPGGALFLSPEAMALRIYRADGRLVYSGDLEKGENRIGLEQGVYLWQAGPYKGKAVIR